MGPCPAFDFARREVCRRILFVVVASRERHLSVHRITMACGSGVPGPHRKYKRLLHGQRVLAICLVAEALGRALGQFSLKPGEGWLLLHPKEYVFDTTEIRMHLNSTDVEEDTLHLIDLNSYIHPYYSGCTNPYRLAEYQNRPCGIIIRGSMDAAYYITKLPEVGQLFQAYRPPSLDHCQVKYPASCRDCCGSNTFSIQNDDGTRSKTCCAGVSDYATRLFHVGEEITSTPSKVSTGILASAHLAFSFRS